VDFLNDVRYRTWNPALPAAQQAYPEENVIVLPGGEYYGWPLGAKCYQGWLNELAEQAKLLGIPNPNVPGYVATPIFTRSYNLVSSKLQFLDVPKIAMNIFEIRMALLAK
jgi:hypothetical protein